MSRERESEGTGRAEARFVAVVDIGKTNVKVVLHDLAEGSDVAVRTTPNAVRRDGTYPHFDAEAIFAFLLDALSGLVASHPLDAISITAHGASAALVGDEDLVLPILDYEHDLSGRASEDYARLRPDFSETFSPRLPNGLNLGNQIYWLQRGFPAEFARVRHILNLPQYWAFRLTGVAAREATSLGCHTDLWAPQAGDFSSMVARLGWRGLFAPERSAFDVLGPLKPEIAEAIGLAAGRSLPVHCGLHDSNASLLPHLLARPAPFSVVSTGTWIVSFSVGGRRTALDPRRDVLVNVDAFGRAVPSSLFMGGREFDLLTRNAAVEPDEAAVEAVLSRGVMALPTFAPGTGPFPEGTGTWIGDPDALSPMERSAAASLYAALMVETALGLIGGDGPTVVEGPFARNRVFVEALAALTGRDAIAATGATGTSAGAALLARGPGSHGGDVTGERPVRGKTSGALLDYAAAWRARANGRTGARPSPHPHAAADARGRTSEL